MKLFSSEFTKDYSSYSFGYTSYCIAENNQEIPRIYKLGYLPYSANTSIEHDVFYMARSLRIDLANFVTSSENKRVAKKMEMLKPKMELVDKVEFDFYEPQFTKFCLDYANARFSNQAMDEQRLAHIFRKTFGTHFFKFYSEDIILGYVYAVIREGCVHYWFSFFDLNYLKSHSLGKYMMWRVAQWANENGYEYLYLGTCYGTHSLYKVRDFKGVQFWNGAYWSDDKETLKMFCKSDHDQPALDTFKSLSSPNEFLNKL